MLFSLLERLNDSMQNRSNLNITPETSLDKTRKNKIISIFSKSKDKDELDKLDVPYTDLRHLRAKLNWVSLVRFID